MRRGAISRRTNPNQHVARLRDDLRAVLSAAEGGKDYFHVEQAP
jgi:hypothetical protein